MAHVVARELPSQSGDNGRLREIIITRLMDRVSESELAACLYALPLRGITEWALRAVHSIESSERRPVQHYGTVESSFLWSVWITLYTTTRRARGDGP